MGNCFYDIWLLSYEILNIACVSHMLLNAEGTSTVSRFDILGGILPRLSTVIRPCVLFRTSIISSNALNRMITPQLQVENNMVLTWA